ncbi:hypothetical protein [Planobispora longispora]|uniref:Uncharacterized protein n=1 Tax=Planobispora longispora TaxID=28887 RepID=A0A8J3RN94_9ACTN|nr:hypothetical protein [Planobispora longispora]BFE79643.1 hypothetical protein GCM10020093_022440 [Planobispora longispora]GIH78074.1 hypothetical protein Plo01_45030 [Planobispora longispora]
MGLFGGDEDGQDQEQLSQDARAAFERGYGVYVAYIPDEVPRKYRQVQTSWGATEAISRIEREGWRLERMLESMYGNGARVLTCMFRRQEADQRSE